MAASAGESLDFEAEARLGDGIAFERPLSRHAVSPRAVFLTGATGLAGVFVLDELLRATDVTVHCLVRAADGGEARARLFGHLAAYGLGRPGAAERIRAVPGDLERPMFGWSDAAFADLAASVDAVYHCAGRTSMLLNYAQLRPAHVLGILDILRLASLHTTKPVHFLSSIAVFYSEAHAGGERLFETDTPRFHPSMKSGYARSKWVADRLVAAAGARGLPTTIHRPVRILGHSRTGALRNSADILPLLLKGCVMLGQYPAYELDVTLVPVDYVARALVHLAGQRAAWGRAFHYVNPAPIAWRHLLEAVRAAGYPMRECSPEQWSRAILERSRPDPAHSPEERRFFNVLRLATGNPQFLFFKPPPFDDRQVRDGLAGTGIACPPFDEALVASYVRYWRESGYFPPAPVASAGCKAPAC